MYAPITSYHASGKCLDIPAGEKDNKVEAQIYDCNGGDNQQWAFIQVDAQNGWGMLKNLYTGKCLDVRGSSMAPQGVVQQYTCGTGDNQLFRRHFGSNLLQVKHSALCISVQGTSNKSKVVQSYCREYNSPTGAYVVTAKWGSYFQYIGFEFP
ncbi:ricin-type beta-trefoil lectin domain protein [Pyxidicoccus fallax]|uniref:Ricin-type beta-trefoil lectin domain protein n=1 Tax=Pyxidicoccus fallax TaxID=394095 RepID=A0A848LXW5_9BACT|nr:RICIN domain-containing protein [Pyxidicoccus fallax]NMO22382.1 ricin-type beta-trefoil lectin domain protein [Pyxidicoccus fallax]NPC85493.1 ricin-type beta-trefoil lectin domain protein [Pyxidicoccus fallax]